MQRTDLRKLKRLVFNGLLAQKDLSILEESGIGIKSPESPIDTIEESDFSPILIHQASRMSSVYELFYCIENAVRELIDDRMSELHGSKWWDEKASKNIKKAANDLKTKEQKNKYHVPRSSAMIGYTTFGNLSQLILNNWEDFSDLFPDQHWVSSRLNDLELSRNVIMHTGLLPEIEIERIESISKDWIRQVG